MLLTIPEIALVLVGPGAIASIATFAVSAALPANGRGILAFASPVFVLLAYVLWRSVEKPGEVVGIVAWVIALSVLAGMELGLFTYSLLHRNPRTPTAPQQHLS